MNSFKSLYVIFAVGLIAGCAGVTQNTSDQFELRKYKEVVLENGLTVLFFDDQSLPRISFQLIVKSGSDTDPKNKSGLNSIVSSMIGRQTTKYSTNELSDEFAALGTDFNSGSAIEYTQFSSVGLSIYRDQLLELFAHTITQPQFDKSEIEKVRELTLASIKRRPDDPGSFLTALMKKHVHGDHAYGNPVMGYAGSVEKLRRRDIIRHYLRQFRPNNSILAVVGKFNADFEKTVAEKFSGWGKRPVKAIALSGESQQTRRELIIIDKSDVKQTQIRVAQLGIARSDKNFLNARAANTVLGGAFVSRLNSRIRDELGLTYGASSGFSDGKSKRDFMIYTFTKHESVGQVLGEIQQILKKFKQQGVTEKELADAKALMRGRFPQSIETADRLAFNIILTRVWGVPETYLNNYMNDVDNIELAQVNRFISDFFLPEKMSYMILTANDEIEKQIESIPFEKKKIEYKKVLNSLDITGD